VNSRLTWSDFSKYQDFSGSNKMSILNLNYRVVVSENNFLNTDHLGKGPFENSQLHCNHLKFIFLQAAALLMLLRSSED